MTKELSLTETMTPLLTATTEQLLYFTTLESFTNPTTAMEAITNHAIRRILNDRLEGINNEVVTVDDVVGAYND